MPTYEYRCPTCGHSVDIEHGMEDETPRRCPRCDSRMNKIIMSSYFKFTGTGFYETDYKGKK